MLRMSSSVPLKILGFFHNGDFLLTRQTISLYNLSMEEAWIDKIERKVREFDTPPSRNIQLKKRLDILRSRVGSASVNRNIRYRSPWYIEKYDAFSLIVEDYDYLLTDIYTHLSYLYLLDIHTKNTTHNRGYYCRKRSQIRIYLVNKYEPSSYCFWTAAWEWFFSSPTQRPPLNSYLFNYIMSLQDEQTKEN